MKHIDFYKKIWGEWVDDYRTFLAKNPDLNINEIVTV